MTKTVTVAAGSVPLNPWKTSVVLMPTDFQGKLKKRKKQRRKIRCASRHEARKDTACTQALSNNIMDNEINLPAQSG
ncbi:hypothetical protein K0M31_005431 [Melipona bicolor]|uniref:Uncharacterized protein n=1 Tax=Melipona bicolor TaxID=60889 RepID=A0AA40KMG3_9HYME|nr:hypothetical protein K0M31_005431 [Melipona bicolor]